MIIHVDIRGICMTTKQKTFAKTAVTFIVLFGFLELMMVNLDLRQVVFDSFLFREGYRYLSFLLLMAFSVLTCYAGYLFAKKKKRDKRLWAILCFFLNIWALIVLLFLPSERKRGEQRRGRP
jgi:cytochrome bd-type quinol oxidase subunit 2